MNANQSPRGVKGTEINTLALDLGDDRGLKIPVKSALARRAQRSKIQYSVFPRHLPREELTADMVMASACLPTVFQAVEIDGVPYWDGGYMGNPSLFPFHGQTGTDDIVVIQIIPIERKGAPKTPQDIQNRMNEIAFNGSLLKELRAIDFVDRLIREGKLSKTDYRQVRVHIIENQAELKSLGASSKMNTEWAFLTKLREMFQGIGGQHQG